MRVQISPCAPLQQHQEPQQTAAARTLQPEHFSQIGEYMNLTQETEARLAGLQLPAAVIAAVSDLLYDVEDGITPDSVARATINNILAPFEPR